MSFILDERQGSHGGVFDALANFWIRKVALKDAGYSGLSAEFNLSESAVEALSGYLHKSYAGAKLDPSVGFELGLTIANILQQHPTDAENQIRDAIAFAVERTRSLDEVAP